MALPPAFTRYLRTVGMTKPLIDRAAVIYDFYRQIVKGPIPGICVSEYITDENQRNYESLWFFTPRLAMEAKSFLTGDDFDLTPLQRIVRIQYRKEEYDFKKATERSRLHVSCQDDAAISYNLKASGINCDHLKDISTRFLLPNLKP